MGSVVPFGATSLHDAIAETARARRGARRQRRAVVVLTDGNDNASHLDAGAGVGDRQRDRRPGLSVRDRAVDRQPHDRDGDQLGERLGARRPLADLAPWTGGHAFVASTPAQRSAAARQIIDELRHQYP